MKQSSPVTEPHWEREAYSADRLKELLRKIEAGRLRCEAALRAGVFGQEFQELRQLLQALDAARNVAEQVWERDVRKDGVN